MVIHINWCFTICKLIESEFPSSTRQFKSTDHTNNIQVTSSQSVLDKVSNKLRKQLRKHGFLKTIYKAL